MGRSQKKKKERNENEVTQCRRKRGAGPRASKRKNSQSSQAPVHFRVRFLPFPHSHIFDKPFLTCKRPAILNWIEFDYDQTRFFIITHSEFAFFIYLSATAIFNLLESKLPADFSEKYGLSWNLLKASIGSEQGKTLLWETAQELFFYTS